VGADHGRELAAGAVPGGDGLRSIARLHRAVRRRVAGPRRYVAIWVRERSAGLAAAVWAWRSGAACGRADGVRSDRETRRAVRRLWQQLLGPGRRLGVRWQLDSIAIRATCTRRARNGWRSCERCGGDV